MEITALNGSVFDGIQQSTTGISITPAELFSEGYDITPAGDIDVYWDKRTLAFQLNEQIKFTAWDMVDIFFTLSKFSRALQAALNEKAQSLDGCMPGEMTAEEKRKFGFVPREELLSSLRNNSASSSDIAGLEGSR